MSDRALPILEQKRAAREAGRTCGPCRVCCTTMAVAEINKAKDSRCQHLQPGMKPCAIYADRPKSCAAFECLYLMGALPAHLRPDKINAMMVANETGDIIQVMIAPQHRGAEKKEPLRSWIEQQRKRIHIIIMCGDSRLLLRPPLTAQQIIDPATGEEIK